MTVAALTKFVRRRSSVVTRAPGSVLYQAGNTTVLCTASIEEQVPPWMKGKGARLGHRRIQHVARQHQPTQTPRQGWQSGWPDDEIQRLIGRSLRAVCDLDALGERSIAVDCDVLEADGGTRTASITGAFIALVDALHTLRDKLDPVMFAPRG